MMVKLTKQNAYLKKEPAGKIFHLLLFPIVDTVEVSIHTHPQK